VALKPFIPDPKRPGLSLHVRILQPAWRAVIGTPQIDITSRTVRISVHAGMRNVELDTEVLPVDFRTVIALPQLAPHPGSWTVYLIGLDGRPYASGAIKIESPLAPGARRIPTPTKRRP
jgi:hypothetical protein